MMQRFHSWRTRHLSEKAFVFILATFVGIVAGLGAFLLKRLIAAVSGFLASFLRADSANWLLLLIPLAGIFLTGIFCRYVMHMRLAHGVAQLMKNLSQKIYTLSPRLTFAPILANTITLGFGGSAGSEGPIAYTGAAIGSNAARLFHLRPRLMMLLVGCGAGAGIAGIFKSPLGGALFTLEVLRMPLTTFSVLLLLVTVVAASMTAYVLSGCTLDIPFDQSLPFDPSLLPFILLLGVFCGLYSLYYSYVMKVVARFLGRFSSPWTKNLCGGLILALLVFLFPALYGEGYGVIGKMIHGDISGILADSLFAADGSDATALLFISGGIILAKCFATSATNSGGGVSGDFAPTLFAGCIAGYFFASLLNHFFALGLPEAHFAYYAMAGVMAGAIRAPLMAMFLTCEMGAAYAYFLPLMLVAAISFGVVRLFTADSYFSAHLDRQNGILSFIRREFLKHFKG